MDNSYISSIPIPACVVDKDGIVTAANPLMKNVFVYEDIIGYNFFTLTGVRREQLMGANSEEIIVDRNNKVFKLWINEDAAEDQDIVVFFDEATARDGVPYNAFIQRGLLQPSGENFVDYHDAFRWLADLVEKYRIYPLKVGYDRYSAQYLVQDLKAYGFQCDDVFQGENLFGVLQETKGLLEDKKIHIGDNDLLKIHLLDSAIKMSTERGRGKLVKVNPKAHIDGMAALIDAMTVRQKWWYEIGGQLQNMR